MKHLTTLLIFISFIFSYTSIVAQRTVSLRQYETIINNYRSSTDPVAAGLDDGEDITHVKDSNNELNQFVGTWKGSYNSRSYEFLFVKKTDYKRFLGAEKYWDMLIGWVTVKDASGAVLYTNTAKPESNNKFSGSNFQGNTGLYRMNFTGSCYNESGNVYIQVKQNGEMNLTFSILPDIKSPDCPNGFTTVLPISPNKVTLIKQT